MGPSETNPVDRLPVLRGRASYKHCRGRARKGHPSKDCAKREVDRGLADGGPACSVGGLVPSQDHGDRRRHSKPRGPQGRGSYTVTTVPVPVCRTPAGGRTHSCFLGPAFFSPAPSCLTFFPSLGSHPKSSFLSQGVKGTPSVRRGPQKARKRVVRRIRRETRLPALPSLTSDADGGRLRSGRSVPAFARAGLCRQGRRLLGARGGRDAPRRRASSYDPQITGRKRRLRFFKPCFSLHKTTSHAKAIFFRKKLEKASLQLQMVWF